MNFSNKKQQKNNGKWHPKSVTVSKPETTPEEGGGGDRLEIE